MTRFRDQGETTYYFLDHRIVACPNCSKPVDLRHSRVACPYCGYNRALTTLETSYFKVSAKQLHLQDYLRIACCGHTLWAANLAHLNFLETYVRAELRERMPNMNTSMASRLPQWIKSHKNRQQILKCIAKLRQKLQKNRYQSAVEG